MVELGQNIILLIRQELADFLLSREQLLDLPRMEIDDDRQQRGRGRQVYVQLQAPSYAHSLLFTFGRPISPGRRALPELLKVRLAEMVQYLSSVRMVQDLSYIPTQQLLTSTALFHTVGKKEFFPLSEQQHLSQLTITLHDEFDRPLRVGRGGNSGEPTFVKLLQKTESMATHHHREHIIRLSSLESADIYTTNCAGDFKIQLTDSLLPQAGDSYDHPQQQWQIALSSIYMPTEIDYQVLLSTAARTHGSLFIDIIRGRRIMRIHFDVDAMMEGGTEYHTLTSTRFVDYVNERLSTAEYAQMQDGSGELAIWLVEVEQGQIQLAFAVEKVVRLGGLFAYLLHRTDDPAAAPARIVGEAGMKVDLGFLNFQRLHRNVGFLHLDCVNPSLVENSWSNVLDMVRLPAAGTVGSMSTYQVQHHNFVPLGQTDMTMLHFQLKTAGGDIVPFKRGKFTIVTLVLQRSYRTSTYY